MTITVCQILNLVECGNCDIHDNADDCDNHDNADDHDNNDNPYNCHFSLIHRMFFGFMLGLFVHGKLWSAHVKRGNLCKRQTFILDYSYYKPLLVYTTEQSLVETTRY